MVDTSGSHERHGGRGELVRFFVFCFFFLQFCSFIYMYVYWGSQGIDPSGYFSFHDVLVVSFENSVVLSFLFLVFGISVRLKSLDDYIDSSKKKIFPGFLLLGIIFSYFWCLAENISFEYEFVLILSACFFGHYVKYPVGMLVYPSRIHLLCGSPRLAFVYLAIVVTGLVFSAPLAVYSARVDFSNPGPEKATFLYGGKVVSFPVVGQLGDNVVMLMRNDEVVVVSRSKVSYVEY